MSYNQYEVTPVKADINTMRTDVDALEVDVAAIDTSALETDIAAVDARVSVLEHVYFQRVSADTTIIVDAADHEWFSSNTDTLSFSAIPNGSNTYRISALLNLDIGPGNTTPVQPAIKFVTTGTITSLQCIITTCVNFTTIEKLQMTATNTNTSCFITTGTTNLENSSVLFQIEGYIVLSTTATFKPVFSFSSDPGGSNGSISIMNGTFIELRLVNSATTNWA